jgi:hypothetical protein
VTTSVFEDNKGMYIVQANIFGEGRSYFLPQRHRKNYRDVARTFLTAAECNTGQEMAAVNVVQDRLSAENKSFPAVLVETQMRYFQTLMEPRNRFQGIDSASHCIQEGRYDSPNPARFLATIDCSKIPAHFPVIQVSKVQGWLVNPKTL